ncbi:MAG: hypothetical protein D8M58_06090 [Calditrichaeota bacterium]|nr:MAG: hypothetical protein DWQ03_20415 [Calditrichota bacterium]MBL1204949.1 hypothetical protein [Calditrichota bacterium]
MATSRFCNNDFYFILRFEKNFTNKKGLRCDDTHNYVYLSQLKEQNEKNSIFNSDIFNRLLSAN